MWYLEGKGMGGCYQCGLADGSETKLCETCHRKRFHQELFVMYEAPEEPVQGMEWSPRTQRFILGGGALFYLSLIALFGFITLKTGALPLSMSADGRYEFYVGGDSVTPVLTEQRFEHVEFKSSSHR
jgi:hypothetical protein